ncbi:hypothetical protein MBRA_02490 [Mycobacterium branderi]|uniref:Fatty-acid--CoA ligase n=1 Tax=Mycobacterium branderi TaxID=43348 RepID=A0ABM7KGG7_9MYCO|nr:hypothetical protein MBRA_02490 [Mycobacterium branderi]
MSLVLASDYRVSNPGHAWSELVKRESDLASIGAHHVVMYESVQTQGRVFVTIGVRNKVPRAELLRSPVVFEWFDSGGVEDIPAVFVGEIVEKIEIHAPLQGKPAGVVVAVIALVDDVATLLKHIHRTLEQIEAAGVQKLWVYQAFDDDREVMVLHQVDDATKAKRLIEQTDPDVAEWMHGAGFGAYPPLFLGTLRGVMRVRAEA